MVSMKHEIDKIIEEAKQEAREEYHKKMVKQFLEIGHEYVCPNCFHKMHIVLMDKLED